MKLYKQFLSLTLVLAIAFPSTLFAQSQSIGSTKVDLAKIPGLQNYLNQPTKLNFAKASKLPTVLLNMQSDFTTPALGVSGMVAFMSFVFLSTSQFEPKTPRRWTRMTEFEILNDPKRLEKYIERRIQILRVHSEMLREFPHSADLQTLHYDVLTQRFKTLHEFFTNIEKGRNIVVEYNPVAFVEEGGPVAKYYRGFNTAAVQPSKNEVIDVIRCLAYQENPQLLLQPERYKNLISSLRLFGFDATQILASSYSEDIFLDQHFKVVEAEMIEFTKTHPSPRNYHLPHFGEKIGKLTKYQPHTVFSESREVTDRILKNRTWTHTWKKIGGAALIGAATFSLLYWIYTNGRGKDSGALIPEEIDLTEDTLISAIDDTEAYIHNLRISPFLSAFFAWWYDTVIESERELKIFDQMIAE